MCESFPFEQELPPAAAPAIRIAEVLRDHGYNALFAGGCVRDALLGREPHDFDVATNAPPNQVAQIFRKTRMVGAAFGVVLVGLKRAWVEVATFRADGDYRDGRRPDSVRFSDPREDALRRDFTVNGMFLDPIERVVHDYVGGRADLQARVVRAIGSPGARFNEDHLRLLRAVRFAAKLDFAIEDVTRNAIRNLASHLARVAPERVLMELETMLAHPSRARAIDFLLELGLLRYLFPHARDTLDTTPETRAQLARLGPDAPFELAFALLLGQANQDQIDEAADALRLSNKQRELIAWLCAHHADLDEPDRHTLADFKRLLIHRGFPLLCAWSAARRPDLPEPGARAAALARRIGGIDPGQLQPAPFVTGAHLSDRGLQPGPIYKEILGALYERQLNEQLTTAADALAELERLLTRRR